MRAKKVEILKIAKVLLNAVNLTFRVKPAELVIHDGVTCAVRLQVAQDRRGVALCGVTGKSIDDFMNRVEKKRRNLYINTTLKKILTSRDVKLYARD